MDYAVLASEAGERADALLASRLPDCSRSFLKKCFADGLVTLNGRPVKPSYRAKEGDCFQMAPVEKRVPEILPQDIALDILYEDDDLLIVNKPKGMVVHPSAGHAQDTLVNAVMAHCGSSLSGINGVLRPGIVHRIDKDTTGSVIVCKNDRAHLSVAEQLKAHTILREYHAICFGLLKEDAGTIQGSIGRSSKDRKKMAINTKGGKEAVTHYRVLQRFAQDQATLVACRLESGRTHQIRVHMTSLHHPVLGDEVYGATQANVKCFEMLKKRVLKAAASEHDAALIQALTRELHGQALHAKMLSLVHPVTGEVLTTDAPYPAYFSRMLQVMR